MLKFLVILLLFTFSHAENNTTLDYIHNSISQSVVHWSSYLDTTISQWMDTNKTCLADGGIQKNKTEKLDSFFQNDKYFEETKDTFIRLRLNSHFFSKQSEKFDVKFHAQLPFDKCRKQFKLFIENDSSTTLHKTTNTNSGIGILYDSAEKYGITSRYSLGLHSSHPYVVARYGIHYKLKNWNIESIQSFQYSTNEHFEEETNIYFDNFLEDDDLFRLRLHRKTGSSIKGFDYSSTFEYYFNATTDAGLRLSQSFYGNSKYTTPSKPNQHYAGIYNYQTSLSYRANIWRDWFFYEISPSINYHRDYNYSSSYALRFFVDIYFGKYNSF